MSRCAPRDTEARNIAGDAGMRAKRLRHAPLRRRACAAMRGARRGVTRRRGAPKARRVRDAQKMEKERRSAGASATGALRIDAAPRVYIPRRASCAQARGMRRRYGSGAAWRAQSDDTWRRRRRHILCYRRYADYALRTFRDIDTSRELDTPDYARCMRGHTPRTMTLSLPSPPHDLPDWWRGMPIHCRYRHRYARRRLSPLPRHTLRFDITPRCRHYLPHAIDDAVTCRLPLLFSLRRHHAMIDDAIPPPRRFVFATTDIIRLADYLYHVTPLAYAAGKGWQR